MGEQTISVRAWSPAQPGRGLPAPAGRRDLAGLVAARLVRAGAAKAPTAARASARSGSSAPAGRRSHEEIVELVPTAGSATRCSRGCRCAATARDVDLEPRDGGTAIHWHSTFHAEAARAPGGSSDASSAGSSSAAPTDSPRTRPSSPSSRSARTSRSLAGMATRPTVDDAEPERDEVHARRDARRAHRHDARRGHGLAVRAGGARVRRRRVGVRRERLRHHHPRARRRLGPDRLRGRGRGGRAPRATSAGAPAGDEVAEARKLLRNAVAPPKPRPVEIGRPPDPADPPE